MFKDEDCRYPLSDETADNETLQYLNVALDDQTCQPTQEPIFEKMVCENRESISFTFYNDNTCTEKTKAKKKEIVKTGECHAIPSAGF